MPLSWQFDLNESRRQKKFYIIRTASPQFRSLLLRAYSPWDLTL